MLEAVVRTYVNDATILTFTDAESAYEELTREDPDLFMTDICHLGMSTDEILARLTERNVRYPIFVISSMADRYAEEVKLSCGPCLDVSFWQKPFTAERFGAAVVAALRRGQQVA